jgi:23S rRNA G2445 N2-methylase RlmL
MSPQNEREAFRGLAVKRRGTKPWERDLKRYIRGPRHRWIVTAPFSFRPSLRRELEELALQSIEKHGAGFCFEARISEIYPVLMRLQCASRLFLLVDSFRAGAAEELYRRIVTIPWELLLHDGIALSVHVSLRRCRIEHEGAAEHTLYQALERRAEEAGLSLSVSTDAPSQMIELFGEDNHFELRLDACGEQLYRRGYRPLVGPAPIRENVAASLLQWYRIERGPFSLFVDPMCGSGTFPIEAWAMAARFPLAGHRRFSIFLWPVFSKAAWNWEAQRLYDEADTTATDEPLFWGCDRDQKMVHISKLNGERAGAAGNVGFLHEEFFHLSPQSLFSSNHLSRIGGKGGALLAINPPYGVRLKGGDNLFVRIIDRKEQVWQGWDLLLLAPRSLSLPSGKKSIDFENGGIPMKCILF